MSKLQFYFRRSLAGYGWGRIRDLLELRRLERETIISANGAKFDVSNVDVRLKRNIAQGQYEKAELEAARAFLKQTDVVLELGSAIGFVGIFCQRELGIRHYVSVEANPATFEMLKRNYELNGLKPNALNCALSDKNGEIEFNIGELFWADSAVVSGPSTRKVRVKASTFDTIYGSLTPPASALIMDIEGAESALEGVKFPERIRLILAELHPEIIGDAKVGSLISEWIRQGFNLVRIDGQIFCFQRG